MAEMVIEICKDCANNIHISNVTIRILRNFWKCSEDRKCIYQIQAVYCSLSIYLSNLALIKKSVLEKVCVCVCIYIYIY